MAATLLRSASILSLAALFAACSSDPPTQPPAPELEMLTVALSAQTALAGETITATAKGTYDDGSQKDLAGVAVMWRSTNNEILEPVAATPGQFLAKKMGTAQIIGSVDNISASAAVTISPAQVASLEIVPATKQIGDGGSVRVAVIATMSDGTRETVTEKVAWQSSNRSVLVPSQDDVGFLVSFGEGMATVTASLDGKSVTGNYEVTPPRIDYMILSPTNTRIQPMMPVQFSAMGHWTDGRYVDVTSMVEWTSSDPAIATIDASGLATAVGDGNVVITGRINDVTASATARTITSGCVYPDNPAMEVRYDTVMPPVFWVDAFDQSGELVDFQLGEVYCDPITHPTVIFVVTAGWCPYCPDYMRMVDGLHTELEAAGALVVYVAAETASGTPASNAEAQSMISHETEGLGKSIRVGDGDTAGSTSTPFGRAVTALPNAYVVRTRDMRVIADQNRSDTYLDLVGIVNNPERLW